MALEEEEATREVPCGPSLFGGRIRVPPSKSVTQRALVAAALAPGSRLVGPLDAEDPRLLAAALAGAGFRLRWEGEEVRSEGFAASAGGTFFFGNNGTGVRFMLAQLAATPGRWLLDGSPRLRQRPVAPLVRALAALGARVSGAAGEGGELATALPLAVDGTPLAGGAVDVEAGVSSQFVSALLLLAPRLPGGLVIRLAAPPPSRPYLDLTADVLARFGVEVTWRTPLEVAVRPTALAPAVVEVEGDWSAAAFPMAAAAVTGGTVEVAGVHRSSRQGDAVVADLLAACGCEVETGPGGVTVRGPARRPVLANLRNTPDLFPPLAVVVAWVGGRLEGLETLAAKESDRLAVMTDRLHRLGFGVRRTADAFESDGRRPRRAARVGALSPAGDHRVAMALAVAGSVLEGVTIRDAECVAKSWPGFWQSWASLFRPGA